ncbi:MAG: 3-phosphoshikimate 1-carboxyvinyltransferase, partial [Pseudomonadales bacterium]
MASADASVLNLRPVRALSGSIALPGSKSVSNRALLLAALARGTTTLNNVLRSEDTEYMLAALTQLGLAPAVEDTRVILTGFGGPIPATSTPIDLNLGLAGTAIRPLLAALTLGQGQYRLDGNARMRERPIAHLVDALRPLGARIEYLGQQGYPPLRIDAHGLNGGSTRIRGDVSSQFLTSLLLAAPYANTPVSIAIDGELVSKPYIDITLNLMARFGVQARHQGYGRFEVPTARYSSPGTFLVEGDASSASYFLAAGAIAGPGITVDGLGRDSIQGDVAFTEVLSAMGARVQLEAQRIRVRPPVQGGLQAIDLDLNHIPDAAMTAAMVALFADGTSHIRNIANW